VAEAVRKEESKFVDLRSEAEDVHNLARLEPINKVGDLALRQQGLLTDTAFILTAKREIPRPHIRTDGDGRRLALIPLTLMPAAWRSTVAEGGGAVEHEAVFHN